MKEFEVTISDLNLLVKLIDIIQKVFNLNTFFNRYCNRDKNYDFMLYNDKIYDVEDPIHPLHKEHVPKPYSKTKDGFSLKMIDTIKYACVNLDYGLLTDNLNNYLHHQKSDLEFEFRLLKNKERTKYDVNINNYVKLLFIIYPFGVSDGSSIQFDVDGHYNFSSDELYKFSTNGNNYKEIIITYQYNIKIRTPNEIIIDLLKKCFDDYLGVRNGV